MEELLNPVFQLVGLFLAHIVDPRAVVAERGIAHCAIELRVVDPVEFKGEEEQME